MDIKTIFQNTLYINLDHRKDRDENANRQFRAMGITALRISAVDTRGFTKVSGMLGCGLSHIKCLKLAKENQWEHVCICEDDIYFTNPSLLKQNLTKFLSDNNSPDWDVLLLGANLQKSGNNIKLNDYSIKVGKAYCTVSYIVKKHYYDTLISNIEEGTDKLKNDHSLIKEYSIDVNWLKLQEKDTFIMIVPPTVTQLDGYSDIRNGNRSYSNELLNVNK